jgi:poly-gamma-glutamate synthesis protein (capsule biosynthesis protein)
VEIINAFLSARSASPGVSAVSKSLKLALSILIIALITPVSLPNLTTTTRIESEVELVAVGDILLDRGVARRLERDGVSAAFGRVRETLSGADTAFGNLECPLTNTCERTQQRISFRADPRYAEALTGAGFDIMSLANNHSMDCGRAGLLETMLTLRRSGINWCGAGRTRAESEAPVVLNVKGIRIAFVGFTAITPPALAALKDDGATVALASRESLARGVAYARRQADVVVVSLHWGVEYAYRPSLEQRELAHAAVEAGADLVLGHHTHTLEGIELIERRDDAGKQRYALIAYSLGNFAFDSTRAPGRRVAESVMLRCRLGRSGLASAEVIPVVLDNYLPRPASPEQAQAILARLSSLSNELKTRITNGRIKG